MKKLLLHIVFSLCVLFAMPQAFAATMSDAEFAQYFAQKLKQTMPDAEVKIVQPSKLTIKSPTTQEGTIFLTNAYTQYLATPDRLDSIVNSHLQSTKAQTQIENSNAAADIFVLLKPADYLANVKRQIAQTNNADKELSLVYEKLNDDLYAFYVFDSETGMRMVSRKDMERLHLDDQAVHQLATQHLEAFAAKKGVRLHRLDKVGAAKIYLIQLDENYEASMLLVKSFWDKKSFDVAGDMVVFVPARNTVLVTGSEDVEGTRIAKMLADHGYRELGYAISPKGFVQKDGNWQPFTQ